MKAAFRDATLAPPSWRQAVPAAAAVAALGLLVVFARRRFWQGLALVAEAVEEVADTVEDAAEDLSDAARARADGAPAEN
ncbi:MAG: hypothetical protein ABR583_02065 [Gaiellaceae bacterium]